ncbi:MULTISPECIES: DMT family transporter [unclassified Neptuniibacter]|uniref:DMT family transporter n=1 Tax=unclassified Neptuniibacter TaxID=2630693 RepID=UPI0025CFE2A8|nr:MULTISPECIES: DMT family transporter [unclassified Neptuniibacter]|tara:strand:- start:7515 stop:8432 length:918 start_codon:yes stop_codon:yes gene_type:complete
MAKRVVGTGLTGSSADNLRGSTFMLLAMAAFAIEDMFIKAAAETISLGVVLALFGFGGMFVFMLMTWSKGEKVLRPEVVSGPILTRAACEIIGRLCFALAITLTPLSSASAILQATPLVVVVGAALIFREHVSTSRWIAIALGFCGVLMIIRPGLDSFNPASLFALLSTLGFAGRDLATRGASTSLSNAHLGVYGFFVLIPTGLVLHVVQAEAVDLQFKAMLSVLGAVAFGVIAYNALTIAMRTGDVSVVTPFRYTRLLFSFALGFVIFGEIPDIWTWIGAGVIVSSGVYTLLVSRQSMRKKAHV